MNQLIIWKDLRLFAGQFPRTISTHSHPVIQLVIAVRGTFRAKQDSGIWLEKEGLLIAPNYAHECDAQNVPIISIDIDPESSLGEWILTNQLKNRSVLDYPSNDFDAVKKDEFSACIRDANWPPLRQIIKNLFHYRENEQALSKDRRVQRVLDYIANHMNQPITTGKLAEVSHLSESRLIHLFKEEMGLPIRNYILWCRLQRVFEMILAGKSLTQSAHEAGFSDQAHMTRTFTKMMGIAPSLITKNSKFVQVYFPA